MPASVFPTDDDARENEVRMRRNIHAALLENLDLAKLDAAKLDDPSMRPRVLTALRKIVDHHYPPLFRLGILNGPGT